MWFTSQTASKAVCGFSRSLVRVCTNDICAWETGI